MNRISEKKGFSSNSDLKSKFKLRSKFIRTLHLVNECSESRPLDFKYVNLLIHVWYVGSFGFKSKLIMSIECFEKFQFETKVQGDPFGS